MVVSGSLCIAFGGFGVGSVLGLQCLDSVLVASREVLDSGFVEPGALIQLALVFGFHVLGCGCSVAHGGVFLGSMGFLQKLDSLRMLVLQCLQGSVV